MSVAAAWRAPAAHAQGFISGHVLDAQTATPVTEASVRAIDQAGVVRLQTLSDSAGFFRLVLPPGSYTLEAERIGYGLLSTPDVQVRRNEAVDIVLEMGIAPIAAAPLLVRSRVRMPVGTETFRRRMQMWGKTGQGRFITREDIAATSVASVNDLLNRDISIRIVQTRAGFVPLLERRGSACMPNIYLNGVRLMSGDLAMDLSTIMSPDDLEGVEIYPNEIHMPGELVGSNNCGAIALWSRTNQGNPFTLRRVAFAAGFVTLGLVFLAR